MVRERKAIYKDIHALLGFFFFNVRGLKRKGKWCEKNKEKKRKGKRNSCVCLKKSEEKEYKKKEK